MQKGHLLLEEAGERLHLAGEERFVRARRRGKCCRNEGVAGIGAARMPCVAAAGLVGTGVGATRAALRNAGATVSSRCAASGVERGIALHDLPEGELDAILALDTLRQLGEEERVEAEFEERGVSFGVGEIDAGQIGDEALSSESIVSLGAGEQV